MDVVIVAPRTYHPQIGPAECKPWRLAASKPSRSLRAWIYRRDGGACVECGATEPLTLDHIWPAVRGGTEWASNLRTLCRSCNSRRGDALRAELGTVFYPSRPRYLEPRECA
jgi:5-methylcytosine-specific restriction endonuclease McrA